MIYAIGDIHGCFSELNEILSLVKSDAEASKINRPQIVILGDMIDRGPASKQVIDLLLSKDFNTAFEAIILLGNHEDCLLKILHGDRELLSRWLHWGGAETIESYGIKFERDPIDKVFERFLKVLPTAHIKFLESLSLTYRHEDWFFVHAGLRPGVPITRQNKEDLTWIFREFLDFEGSFGPIVVHGHSVTESGEVEILHNRIAVDTGAGFPNGKLSAVRLEHGTVTKTFSSR